MINTIAQAYQAVTIQHTRSARWLKTVTSSRDIRILKTETAALGAISNMIKGLQRNPRVEHVSLKSLEAKSEDDIRKILTYTPFDPDADTTQMQLDRFQRKLRTFAQNLRQTHFGAFLSHRSLLNRIEAVIRELDIIRQASVTFRLRNGYDDPTLTPLERQKRNRSIHYRELLHLRKYLYEPLSHFYDIKADIDLYCARHPDFKHLITEIDHSLNDLFDAVCAGSRSIGIDISDNTTVSLQYSITETYQYIINAIPHLRPELQSMLKEILPVLNHLTCLRNTLNMPVPDPEESEQSILAKYAREHCDGVLLLPLCQALDVNVANFFGMCGGFSRSFVRQLVYDKGFFARVNKLGPIANIENSTHYFHFYNSNLEEVHLQQIPDEKITDYESGSFPIENTLPLEDETIKKTNVSDMEKVISDRLYDPSRPEFFSTLSFWERGERKGHGVALCYMNNQVHFMDANYGYFRFDTRQGFLKFLTRYAQMSIPAQLRTIRLDTYAVDGIRPKASAPGPSSLSDSRSSSSSRPFIHLNPGIYSRRATIPSEDKLPMMDKELKDILQGLKK